MISIRINLPLTGAAVGILSLAAACFVLPTLLQDRAGSSSAARTGGPLERLDHTGATVTDHDFRRALLSFVSGIGLASSALAADMVKVGDIVIHEPWARASLGNAPNSVAYMTLETAGAGPDRLVGGSSPVATKVELHTSIVEGGIAKMRPVHAVEVTPGEPTVLEPGGLHLMIMGLTEKLEEGGTMPLTLVFENAGEVTLDIPVRAVAAGGMDHGGHGSMDHGKKATN